MHSFTGIVSIVIPSRCANGTALVRCQVEEVDVLSFICDHRDGSRNRGTRHFVKNHGGGSFTHVVVELDGTNVLEVVVVLVAFRNRSGTWQYPGRS